MAIKIRYNLATLLLVSGFAPAVLAAVSASAVWAAIELREWQVSAANPVQRLERHLSTFPQRLPADELDEDGPVTR